MKPVSQNFQTSIRYEVLNILPIKCTRIYAVLFQEFLGCASSYTPEIISVADYLEYGKPYSSKFIDPLLSVSLINLEH